MWLNRNLQAVLGVLCYPMPAHRWFCVVRCNMGKNKGKGAATAAPATAVLPGPVTLPTQPAVPQVLAVKAGLSYRGARAAWYAVLVQYNGQPGNAYLAACAATPPSLPKSGRPEAPSGWLRYFVRTGACTLQAAAK